MFWPFPIFIYPGECVKKQFRDTALLLVYHCFSLIFNSLPRGLFHLHSNWCQPSTSWNGPESFFAWKFFCYASNEWPSSLFLFTANARSLGVVLDDNMLCNRYVSYICRSSFYQLRNLSKIRKYLTQESRVIAVHAFIKSKLDYSNSLLYGCRKMQLKKLQYVQNTAARIITRTRKFDHITPVLSDLHWLPVSYRIVF